MSEINIKSSTIEKGLDLAKGLLEKVVGPTFDELGLLMSSNVKMYCLKNQIKNLEKVKKIVDENKLSLKQVNLKVLFPYLEGISVEDDETLQDMWANLFTNYIDASKNLKINVYPNILKQITKDEVLILEYVEVNRHFDSNFHKKHPEINDTNEQLANLFRLGLLIDNVDEVFSTLGYYGGTPQSLKYVLSPFASEFLKACRR